MYNVFPFGFPWATAMYLTLYVGTLFLHVLLMNYVIAGTAYLAWSGMGGKGSTDLEKQTRPLDTLLRDWMPFALGGAITAGVAPLLFVQILYQKQFYTANLLLFHRWMVILPALIIGFYLLYLYKSNWIAQTRREIRIAVGLILFACFAFVGYSWTENHLLANQGQGVWSEFYRTGQVFYFDRTLMPRLLTWFLGAFPTMLMLAAWQLRYFQHRCEHESTASTVAGPDKGPYLIHHVAVEHAAVNISALALTMIIAAVASGLWYLLALATDIRGVLFSRLAAPYLLLACAGLVIQGIAWWQIRRTRSFLSVGLHWVTLGTLLTLLTMTVVRETIRLAHVPIEDLFASHADSAQIGGMWVFLSFLVINALIVMWCLRGIASSRSNDLEKTTE